jgi:hypothetical protein
VKHHCLPLAACLLLFGLQQNPQSPARLLAFVFWVKNKPHKNSSIKNQKPKRKAQKKRLEKQAV